MQIEKMILAIVSMDSQQVSGGSPIFIVENEVELQQVAFSLEKILDGIAHAITEKIMIIVRH
ncbi:capping complex subunit for YIEGIA [Rubeoparvulum massiliense]|uniref:capping complex subunit for YIEGIA n=1 Tax=Rubeoparvulum massiliense TaxID=1631346 RepID=UPI00065E27CC|nr:hypothetical protein [Rubeoparvulum massiliense]